MVTGTMGSDEGDMIIPFIRAASAAEKIAAVADLPDDQPLPGEYFRYLSTNTFVLSCAISEFVRKREKSQVDYWNMLAADVLEPLGIYDLVLTRTVEPDNSAGIPVLSWGSYPTLNETARIAELLLNGGVHKGRSLLSGLRTREAVVPGYWKGFVEHYRHSFWWESVMIGSCTVTAPYMSGRGGNSVVLSPGGLVLILFSDNMNYDIAPLLRAAEELQSACN
jgi:CubicO group peptidase (beta-lactamase class C family)